MCNKQKQNTHKRHKLKRYTFINDQSKLVVKYKLQWPMTKCNLVSGYITHLVLPCILILELTSPVPHDSIQTVIHLGRDLFNFHNVLYQELSLHKWWKDKSYQSILIGLPNVLHLPFVSRRFKNVNGKKSKSFCVALYVLHQLLIESQYGFMDYSKQFFLDWVTMINDLSGFV